MTMPRTLQKTPKKSVVKRRALKPKARGNVFDALEPKILTPEEKHELIRAHASARANQDRGPHLGYVIAIAASTLMVTTGWLLSFGRGIWLTQPSTSDAAIETIRYTAESVKSDVQLFQQQAKELKNNESPTTTQQ